MTKIIKVGEDLTPNMFIMGESIHNIELSITLQPSAQTSKIITLPCIVSPERIDMTHDKNYYKYTCYKYNFYHSDQELHNAITTINNEFEIQVTGGGSLITDRVISMNAANLSVILSKDYPFSMPGILISNDKEIPLYIIQVVMYYE